MEMFANKFKRIRLSDVTKEVKVSQSIQADPSGETFSRVYKITLHFESFHKIKNLLGLTFEEILKVFSDKFVTLLLNEISKQLKKTATASGFMKACANQDDDEEMEEVKTIGSKKTGASAKKKGSSEADQTMKSSAELIEEEEKAIKKKSAKGKENASKGEDDEDEDNGDEQEEDFNTDIDGVLKKSKDVRSYEMVDEDAVDDNEEQNEQADEDELIL